MTNFFQNTCGITPEEKQLSVSGRNWGEVDLNGQSCSFLFKLILIDFITDLMLSCVCLLILLIVYINHFVLCGL